MCKKSRNFAAEKQTGQLHPCFPKTSETLERHHKTQYISQNGTSTQRSLHVGVSHQHAPKRPRIRLPGRFVRQLRQRSGRTQGLPSATRLHLQRSTKTDAPRRLRRMRPKRKKEPLM